MATPVVFAVYDGSGAPLTGAAFGLDLYVDRAGNDRTPPAIDELGGGLYAFTPSDDDEALGVAYKTEDTGGAPAYFSGAVHLQAAPFCAFFVDGSGDPEFATYCDLEGNARTPPSILDLQSLGELYCFTPSEADLALGVAFEIDCADVAGTPPRFSGYFEPPSVGGGGGEIPVQVPDTIVTGFGLTSASLGKALPIGRDLQIDPDTRDLILANGDLVLVKDGAAIRQEAQIRMGFFLGEWFLDQTQGVPYFQDIFVKAPNLSAIKTVLSDEVLKTVGISSLTSMLLDHDASARTLRVTWKGLSDLNELINGEVTL